MQSTVPSASQEISMFDEVSALLKTRLEFHQWQLQHHQKRIDEIQDMSQYLAAKFAPQPVVAQPSAEAVVVAVPQNPVEIPVSSVATELPTAPPAADVVPAATEPAADPHQALGYQSMY